MKFLTEGAAALAILAVSASMALAADMQKMNNMQSTQMASSRTTIHHGEGTISAVETKAGSVTISHGPIASMNWPAMSMTFHTRSKTTLARLKTGEKVKFSFHEAPKGQYQLNTLIPVR